MQLKIQPCEQSYKKIALAVSGGGDSMAMAHMVKIYADQHHINIIAYTVDHGLRAESKTEAEKAHTVLTALGIPHKILKWQGAKPDTHIQERARDARYRLLVEACKTDGFDTLAIAHNAEDQIETFWMRLAHGSGLDGLAGIAETRDVEGIKIIRPVMHLSRQSLRDYCVQHKIEYIDDPSNTNEKYLRVKLRAFEEMLAGEGFTVDRLSRTIEKLKDARAALECIADEAIKKTVTFQNDQVLLNKTEWLKYPFDIQARVAVHIFQTINPQNYNAGYDQIKNLITDMSGDTFKGRTLAGCKVNLKRDAFVFEKEF